MKRFMVAALAVVFTSFPLFAQGGQGAQGDQGNYASQVTWTKNTAPSEAYITGGGWTLEQSGAANGLKSAGYCTLGVQNPNPGTERMEPYYFPVVKGYGNNLQGYFDYRPKDINEAIAAAYSTDGGHTWTFQQKVLELNPDGTTYGCPQNPLADPDGDSDLSAAAKLNNSDNSKTTGDDGQGHQFVIHINGHTYLYTLERANGHIDVDDLYIHEIFPQPGSPLHGAPTQDDGATDAADAPEISTHTYGLLNPDGILGIVPGKWPLTIIYEQKILGGDSAFAPAQQCSFAWGPYYTSNPFGTGVNDDVTYLRLATTTDGIHFTDLGALNGLNVPTDTTAKGTRWLATAGTILKLANGKYGLLFSGGGCISGDSDAFQYIGYAESIDLMNWTVINGIDNPIISTAKFTNVPVDANGVYNTSGPNSVTFPNNTPVAGNAMGWFSGRVYAPSGALFDPSDLTVMFAGYHTPKPKNGLGDYRTIGTVNLHSSVPIVAVGSAD